ncbi:hypothetical protein HWV62_5165 [Athelia sp. TMB]|nr:hypothetical protein HWV62_5165 [Athelia sp. TMB]
MALSTSRETEAQPLAAGSDRSEGSVRPSEGDNRVSPVSPTPARPHAGEDLTRSVRESATEVAPENSEGHRSPASEPVFVTAPTPTVRFDNLEGQLPGDQIELLRAFSSHHALGIHRLKVAEANLSNLNGQLNEVKEHTTSLTRRIDRAMSDNSRFLLESDAQLSELSRIFDRPRMRTPITSGITPESIPEPAQLRGVAPRASSLQSDDDLYGPNSTADAEESASRINRNPLAIDSITRVANSSSSRASLPAQQPNETAEQYDARYESNIRNIDRNQESWARAYPDINNARARAQPRATDAGITGTASRDVHFERPGTHGRDTGSRGYDTIPRAGPTMPMMYESASRPPGINPYSGVNAPPIGLSAYRVTQGPVTNGLWNNDHYHYVVLLGKITQLINHKVGSPVDVPTGFKQPKLAEPPKYSGSHSHDDFVDWLSSFLNWLRGHYICGPNTDSIRLTYLGLYVDGVASDWYLTEVDNPSRHYDPALLFADCICLMHKRFVRTATANDAAIKYSAVRYVTADGVEGLYYKLDTAAERMIERPSNYEFRRRLFNLLPHWLHDKLKDRNIIPEYASLEDIRENAKQIEENSLRRYEGVGDTTTSSTPRASTSRQDRAPKTTEKPRNLRSSGAVTGNNNGRPDKPNVRPSVPPVPGRPARTPRDTSTMQCYSCGKMGHISSEPICENYDVNKARLHAQRELDYDAEDSEQENQGCVVDAEHSGSEHGSPPRSWGGSQYESEHEDALPDSRDDEASDNPPRLASMYVRMAAMRVTVDSPYDEGELSDTMPALMDCSDSEDDDPIVTIGARLSTRQFRTVMDLRDGYPTFTAPTYRIPTRYVDDRGLPTSPPTPISVDLVNRTVLDLEEHIPNPDTIRVVNHTVWIDIQERVLRLDDGEDLEGYNRLLSMLVPCHICDGVCRPTVYQVLARIPAGEEPQTHMTLYACNLPRRLVSPARRVFNGIDNEDQYSDPHGDYSEESMYAMRYSSNIRRHPVPGEITRPRHNQETITTIVVINGHKALALFDSGSTTDSITPEFGFVSRTKQFKLDNQITLQLGCVGSRSKISYGAVAPISIFTIAEEMYFDVVNIDRYDAILGTPFLRKHGLSLDFKNGGIVIEGRFHKTFSMSEELAYLAQKGGDKEASKFNARPKPRETAPIRPRRDTPEVPGVSGHRD